MAATGIAMAKDNQLYSQVLILRAQRLYAWAKRYQGAHYDQWIRNGTQYTSRSYRDDMAWAAIWIYRATADATYLAEAEAWFDQHLQVSLLDCLGRKVQHLFAVVIQAASPN